MAVQSQTDLAVLGALSVEPMTGYELRNNIRDVLGHFWSESFGQIYPALTRLQAEGLVVAKTSERSTSTRYSTTAAGRKRLRELLAGPIQQRPPRNATLLRLFFGRFLGNATCLQIIEENEVSARKQLEHLRATAAAVEREATPDSPYFLITIDLGIRVASATIEWAEASRRRLQSASRR